MKAPAFYLSTFLISVSLCSCALIPGGGPSEKPWPEQEAIWLANASPVDFGDLFELHKKPESGKGEFPRYEGFFEKCRVGSYRANDRGRKNATLSPEAEWVIWFAKPGELERILAPNKPNVGEQLQGLEIELRGMIEGKWIDVLRDESRRTPTWRDASGENNVVACRGIATTVGELDEMLRVGPPFPWMEIFRVKKGEAPAQSQLPLYSASLGDLAGSSLIAGIRNGGRKPIQTLIQVVGNEFVKQKGKQKKGQDPPVGLRAVNLSAHGPLAALVNDPGRHLKAKATHICKKGWLFFKFGLALKNRIGMRLVAEHAVDEGTNGLSSDMEYLMHVYNKDNDLVGQARLGVR